MPRPTLSGRAQISSLPPLPNQPGGMLDTREDNEPQQNDLPPSRSSHMASSRGGQYHHERPHQYHPYARPVSGGTSYRDPSHLHQSYGYEYDKPYSMPQMTTQLYQQGKQMQAAYQQGPHHIDSSPHGEEDGILNRPSAAAAYHFHQSQLMAQVGKQDESKKKGKKPPRPYTEYNIFFQLERERILGELEEQQRQSQAAEGGGESNIEAKKEDAEEECAKEASGTEDPKVKDEPNDDEATTSSPKEGVILNRPSDANDILPRPPRFAHLHLSPLWYDSTHRLAENKKNKARRKHRKTHGLVGFLDLTRRIAKSWGEVDPDTKAYCKRVADRQLKIYKEELKLMKKKQSLGEGGGLLPIANPAQAQTAQQQMQQQMIMRMREASGMMHQGRANQDMMPPIAHHGYDSYYWQQQQQQQRQYQQYQQGQQHQGPPYQQQRGHTSRLPPYYTPPGIPPLTPPTSEHIMDERNSGYYGSGGMHTPLDELMRRRDVYGSRSAALQAASPRKRSPGTSRSPNFKRESDDNDDNDKRIAAEALDELGDNGKQQPNRVHSTSYLSPADGSPSDRLHKASTAAITPSPSRRHSGSLTLSEKYSAAAAAAGSLTPSQLPMKKRLKRLDDDASSPDDDKAALSSPGSIASATRAANEMSPVVSSPLFAMSPTGIMTPQDADRFGFSPFGASPMSGGSSYRKSLVGPYLNGEAVAESSPFPYIDWGSPRDSPQDGSGRGKRLTSMPPHLAVPGSHYPHPASHPHPPGWHDDFADEGVLDLDEEEMKLLWQKVATHAKRKRMRDRDAATAWMNYYSGGLGSFAAASPGGPMGIKMAHSFSSPVERPETVVRGSSCSSGPKVGGAPPLPPPVDATADRKDTGVPPFALKDATENTEGGGEKTVKEEIKIEE